VDPDLGGAPRRRIEWRILDLILLARTPRSV